MQSLDEQEQEGILRTSPIRWDPVNLPTLQRWCHAGLARGGSAVIACVRRRSEWQIKRDWSVQMIFMLQKNSECAKFEHIVNPHLGAELYLNRDVYNLLNVLQDLAPCSFHIANANQIDWSFTIGSNVNGTLFTFNEENKPARVGHVKIEKGCVVSTDVVFRKPGASQAPILIQGEVWYAD